MKISERKLSDYEVDTLITEIRTSPDVGLYTKNQWGSFEHVFVIEDDNFIGVCVTILLNEWVKIGPVIILKSHQNKAYGKR